MNEGGSGEKESVAAGDASLHGYCRCWLGAFARICVCAASLSESHSWPTTGMSACTVWSTTLKQMYAHPRAEADTHRLKVWQPVSM